VTAPVIPGFTLAQAAQESLQLGRITGATVTHGGGSVTRLMGLYAGRVFVHFNAFGATGNNVNFQIQPQPTNTYGTQNLVNIALGAANNIEYDGFIALPRAPCVFVITNNEAANDVTVNLEVIAEESHT